MACTIIRNKETKEIEKVLASNGKESILYDAILKFNKYKESALKLWARVYTPTFKAWFGDWENNPEGASKVVDENGEPLISTLIEYMNLNSNSGVAFKLKAINILRSAEATTIFAKGEKNKWGLDKILTELQVPKEQIELLKQYDVTDREGLLVNMLADYSYTIQINTATKERKVKALEDQTSKAESSEEINSKVESFLEKIGVSIQAVNEIRDKDGNKINAVAKASMLNKIIEIIEGKASTDTLPEEAAHFFVEMLGEGHPLFKQMDAKITSYDVYRSTLAQYKNNKDYRNPDGTIRFDKIRKEAMGKLIAEHIVNMEPGAETEARLVGAITWWQKLWEFVKSVFQKADENPFENIAGKILRSDIEDLNQDPVEDEEFYQLTDPIQALLNDQVNIKLDNSIDYRTGQKRHIYTHKGEQAKGSVTSVYVDAWLKKIFKTDKRSELQKIIDLAKAEFGDVVHEQIQDIIKSWTNPDGTMRATQGTIAPKVDASIYKKLNGFIQELMKQYDPNTRFFAEVKIYDQKTKIAGSIDLLIIKGDGVVDIYDWKTQQIFKDQTDIKGYKEPMYRIQLENYRKILQLQYGFTQFDKIRAIPIATQFNINKTGIKSLKGIEIGSLDVKKITDDKSYLLPVTLRTESTGEERVDSLIEQLYGVYDKIEGKRLNGEELFKRKEELNQLRIAIRDLQLKNEVNKLIDLGIIEFKKYTDKLNSNTLTGKDIPEALSILQVFSESNNILYELRQEILDGMDKEKDKVAIKKFEATDQRFRMMTSQVKNLLTNIEKYRDKQSEILGEKFGIMNLLDPEKAIGTLKGWFSSLSNITQKSFRVFSKLLRLAQNKRDAQFDKTAAELKGLKDKFTAWASSKGISTDKAMQMILNIDDKGNWNGNFLTIYRPEFKIQKEKAIEEDNPKWILKNMIFDDVKYEEAEKKQIEYFKSIGFAAEEEENEKVIKKKIKEWIEDHKVVNDNDTINKKALMNGNNRFLKPNDIWHTEKWNVLNRSENKAIKDVYEYFQGLLRKSEKMGMLDKYSPHFIPSVLATKMDQLVFGNVKDLFSGRGLFENLQVDSGTKFSPEIDPTTGEVLDRVPVYFTKDMGVAKEDGTTDYSKKSRDLFKVFGVWAAHTYNYEAMTNLEGDALLLYQTEYNSKKMLVTDNYGNIVIENGRVKAVKQNDKNSDTNSKKFAEFMNYYLYDKANGRFNDMKFTIKGKEYSVMKSINAAINYFGIKTLALNVISGTANFVGGNGNALFMAQKGIFFTKRSWALGMQLATGDKKAQAALRYLNILQEGNQHTLIDNLSLSTTNTILKKDNLFIIQRTTDKLVQYPLAIALMINHMVENGKIVDIQRFVKDKYDYNNTFYQLSSSEQSALRDKIDKEVKELQDKRSLLKIGKLDANNNFLLEGIEKDSDEMSAFRDKIKGITKKILGNNSRDDVNRIRTTMLGSACMQFRNWMPEMVEDRFGGLQYDDELQTWTYGKLNQFARDFFSSRAPKLLKAIATGFGSNAVDLAKQSYERLQREAFEQGQDFTVTEGEFIDMYIGNLRSAMTELLVMMGFLMTIFSIAAAGGDDDDDETKGMKAYMGRALRKYYSEFAFFWTPLEFTRLVNKPLPVVGLAEDMFRFVGAFNKEIIGQALGDKKMTKAAKPEKYFFKLFPIAKEAMLMWAIFDSDFRKEWDIKLQGEVYFN